MFNSINKKRKNTMARNESSTPEKLNRIVEGTVIDGEIKSESNIRIDGHVKGHTTTKGRLVVGPNGIIEGEVICANADIEGQLNGKITVTELLSLKASAHLNGDILTKKLAIEPGAIFTGNCSMGAKVKDLLSAKADHNTPLAKAK
jgi:cytoskeletal protein CcmA (bactofilin family)